MMKNLIFYILLINFLSACQSKQPTQQPVTHTDSTAMYTVPDEKAINKAVLDVYAKMNFKRDEKPDYEKLKQCFIPKAHFIDFSGDTSQVANLSQFIYLYRTYLESKDIQSFNEVEVFGKTEQFGLIASHLSTYKYYLNGKDDPEQTGVTDFQLIKTPKGWKVSSVIWYEENDSTKVPGYYLKK